MSIAGQNYYKLPGLDLSPITLAAIAGIVLFLLQVLVSTEILVAANISIAITIGLVAVFIAGPLTVPGLLNLMLVVKVLLIAVLVKTLVLHESTAMHLLNAEVTSFVMVLGFIGVLVATLFVKRLQKKKGVFPVDLEPSTYKTLAWLMFIGGYGAWWLVRINTVGDTILVGPLWSLLKTIRPYGFLSIAVYMLHLERANSRRFMSHPVVILMVLAGTLTGIFAGSKLEAMSPVLAYNIMSLTRYGWKRKEVWAVGCMSAVIFVYFVYPYAQSLKNKQDLPIQGYTYMAMKMAGCILFDPNCRNEIEDEVLDFQPAKGEMYFGNTKVRVLQRFAMISEEDHLISSSVEKGELAGGKTIIDGFLYAVPYVLYPDKPQVNTGNFLGRFTGDLRPDDERTQVSYGFMAELFYSYSYAGVVLGTILLLTLIYSALIIFFGYEKWGNIWTILVVLTMHHSIVEGGIGTQFAEMRTPIYFGIFLLIAKAISRSRQKKLL